MAVFLQISTFLASFSKSMRVGGDVGRAGSAAAAARCLVSPLFSFSELQ